MNEVILLIVLIVGLLAPGLYLLYWAFWGAKAERQELINIVSTFGGTNISPNVASIQFQGELFEISKNKQNIHTILRITLPVPLRRARLGIRKRGWIYKFFGVRSNYSLIDSNLLDDFIVESNSEKDTQSFLSSQRVRQTIALLNSFGFTNLILSQNMIRISRSSFRQGALTSEQFAKIADLMLLLKNELVDDWYTASTPIATKRFRWRKIRTVGLLFLAYALWALIGYQLVYPMALVMVSFLLAIIISSLFFRTCLSRKPPVDRLITKNFETPESLQFIFILVITTFNLYFMILFVNCYFDSSPPKLKEYRVRKKVIYTVGRGETLTYHLKIKELPEDSRPFNTDLLSVFYKTFQAVEVGDTIAVEARPGILGFSWLGAVHAIKVK